ncbi:ribonuclease H-like domain-containing protein [Endogone sp. FLAS-F59071]|nr:ribonuclease H-like domain-containing protein [Endogone sp. FLAS-F59071]|eukprot:RUS23332.1 ribonuclease H-like domain-containing protein [Endogone sp. FLAS-F59071]
MVAERWPLFIGPQVALWLAAAFHASTRFLLLRCENDQKPAHRLIEIAVLLTDGDLNVVAEGPELVIHQTKEVMDSMSEWCIEHHVKSGLTAAVLASTITTAAAEEQVLHFIRQHIPERGIVPLAGNSVHVDRQFLEKEMPKMVEHLHYRIVGIPTSSQAALDDIKESIAELRYYRECVFVPSKSETE